MDIGAVLLIIHFRWRNINKLQSVLERQIYLEVAVPKKKGKLGRRL